MCSIFYFQGGQMGAFPKADLPVRKEWSGSPKAFQNTGRPSMT